jgi:transcriptional regulator with XRE-family HTH domain
VIDTSVSLIHCMCIVSMDAHSYSTGRVSLPFYGWRLTAARSIPGYPHEIRHIGHHLLKRRLDRQLEQRQAAKLLGVHGGRLENWEYGRTEPGDRFYPAIIKFLGFNPLPKPTSRGEAIRRERMSRGWSIARLASMASVDEATVARLERDVPRPARRPTNRVLRALMLIP